MGILRRISDWLSGPPRVEYGSGDEGAEAMAAVDEEMPAAASDEAELERVQAAEKARPGVYEPQPGVAAFEESEAEAADDHPENS